MQFIFHIHRYFVQKACFLGGKKITSWTSHLSILILKTNLPCVSLFYRNWWNKRMKVAMPQGLCLKIDSHEWSEKKGFVKELGDQGGTPKKEKAIQKAFLKPQFPCGDHVVKGF